jgi:hypothetical protein
VPSGRWLLEAGRSFPEVMIILFVFGISSLGNVNGSCRAILKRVRIFVVSFTNYCFLTGLQSTALYSTMLETKPVLVQWTALFAFGISLLDNVYTCSPDTPLSWVY